MDQILQQLGINMDFQFIFIYATLLWMRLLAVVAVVPFLFGRPVPMKARVGCALVMMFFLFPLLKPLEPPHIADDMLLLGALYMKEILVGIFIGFAASMIFYGFDAAGVMIDNQRGASLARVLIPQLGTQGSISSQLLFQMAIVLYLVFGGHLLFLKALFESYQTVPLFEFPHVGPGLFPMIDFFIQLSATVLVLSVQIAAPVIIAILVADVVLGLTNRFAPQINVWELGFNVRGVLGILALFVSFGIIAREIHKYSVQSVDDAKTVIELLQGSIPEKLKDVETPPKLQNLFTPTGETVKPPSVWDRTIKSLTKEEMN